MFPSPFVGLMPATFDAPSHRLALYAVRRMASSGAGDAFAAQAFLTAFGVDFRRPLVLMRAFMIELARASARTITVAPCCCPRVTAAENGILTALSLAASDPAGTGTELAAILGVCDCTHVLDHAIALAAGFADCGLPLGIETA